jgi:GT2 family glycosyltransferase
MRTFYFSATKGLKKNTLLFKTGNKEFFFKTKNTDSIAKVYNKAIDFAIQEDADFLVLCHDDVIIESNLEKKIPQMFEKYDIFGVAGTTECKLEKPVLWHLMGGGFEGNNLRGAVAHGSQDTKSMTYFGPYPKRVIMIDGVFMAIKREVFTQIRFDESCPAKFHMYDLDYSLQAHKAGFKVGVSDIMITHASPGLKEFTSEFNEGQDWFLDKWKGKL